MGLDYSYLLYFERKDLWRALHGLEDIAYPHQPPSTIIFPDRELSVPFYGWGLKSVEYQFDQPELNFGLVIQFMRDKYIEEYHLANNPRDEEDIQRSPPDSIEDPSVGVGLIYLSVYQQNPYQPDLNHVLFKFGTTGTRMSILFTESMSIRKTFTEFLESIPGVCGIFDREMFGEIFWYKGSAMSREIADPYLSLDEMDALF
jgi:hypothetical protein